MNKISLFLLMSFTATSVLAQNQQQQGQPNCGELPSDQERLACYERFSNGGFAQQQQSMRKSDRVSSCESLLGSRASRQDPATPVATVSESQTEGGPVTRTRTYQEGGNTEPTYSAISVPSTTQTTFWQSLTQQATAPVAPATIPIISPDTVTRAKACRSYQMAAAGNGSSEFGATAINYSWDRRIFCVQKAGYTVDYRSCMNALGMYNNVRAAEAALFVIQSAQANNNQQQAQNSALQRTAAGDGQNAAYDAQISMTSKASELNQQKAMAYAAAVAALGSQLASWIKDDENTVKSVLCRTNPNRLGDDPIFVDRQDDPATTGYITPAAVSAPRCPEAITTAYRGAHDEMFANDAAKAGIKAALVELVAKGIQAGIAARQLGQVAKKVEEARDSTEDPYNPAQFEYCSVSPNDPRCITSSGRTPGSGLQDGGFSLGDGFGVNAFNPLGDAEDMTNGEQAPLPGDNRVADTTNPFTDDAKKANDILDPAAAASIQPGGGAGGGGGGGGGLPGGGSASLGNDVPGVDESKKENDIKANKADGKYNIAGGGSFQAVKPMAPENPFANLFGGKGGGGLEEDRGPASGDIDGKDSGLFAKISKRYGQVQADKRIEAKNLEE